MHLPASPSSLARVRRGVRQSRSWLQLARFGLVGASGYVVNLATFAGAVSLLHLGHRAGATLAFCVAVTNNFLWNRLWTFRRHRGSLARFQAARFLTVSVSALLPNLLLLRLFVETVGLDRVAAQVVAVCLVMPITFLGNKLWSFR